MPRTSSLRRRGRGIRVFTGPRGLTMLRVGLTGGIGSGKSEVSRRLTLRGAVLIDADVAARQVVVPGSRGLTRIAAAFGDDVLHPDGSLDRERLGAIVFGDPGLRAKLNAIVHPLVRQWMLAADRAAVQAAGPPGPVIVHDVPLLAESRGKGGFDLVIVVDVPPQLQGRGPGRPRGRTAGAGARGAPSLAESGGRGAFARVLVVDGPPELQGGGLVSLRGMTPEQARARM